MKTKVFISSTCFDLIDLRAEIKTFLDDLGFNPIMSDQFTSDFEVSTNSNSIETCLINLRSSDYVIFFLSKRYGSLLGNYGFQNISATHLEYKEAVIHNKPIIFFVRDRLEADYNSYKKGNTQGYLWIGNKDLGLFNFIDEHKALSSNNSNNWYWPFKSSIEVKERLAKELKLQIKSNRLNKIIESGLAPYLALNCKQEGIIDKNIKKIVINIEVENLGSQPAIDPLVVITKAKSYQEVIEEKYYTNSINFFTYNINSLKPNSKDQISQEIDIQEEFEQKVETFFVIEVIYKTIFGDLISDISEVKVNSVLFPDISIKSNFKIKRYISDKAFERLVSHKN